MLSKNIKLKKFQLNKTSSIKKKKILNILRKLLKDRDQILSSMDSNYKDSYSKKIIINLKKINYVTLIGMGGSILGAKAIYKFLKPKLKKFNFIFLLNIKFI